MRSAVPDLIYPDYRDERIEEVREQLRHQPDSLPARCLERW